MVLFRSSSTSLTVILASQVAVPYSKYNSIDSLLEADADHWLYREGNWAYHGEMGTSNPFLGHAMERSWPLIFGCNNASIVDDCQKIPEKEQTKPLRENCQCLDL